MAKEYRPTTPPEEYDYECPVCGKLVKKEFQYCSADCRNADDL